MAQDKIVPVTRMLDQGGLTSFQIRVLVWSIFIVLADGYDIGAIAFAAPHLIHEWKVAPSMLGPVFGAGLIGILFGSAIFGWMGDRFGRKWALVASLLWFGVWTCLAALATDLTQMFWLRLLAGIGIGGIIPNAVAINVECAPTRLRATLGIVAAGLVPLGGAIPGFVAATLVAEHGWQILFWLGGLIPIAIALAAAVGMPESVKFLAVHDRRVELSRIFAKIVPTERFDASCRYVIEDEHQYKGYNPVNLFRDGMAVITPLLWLLFALNLMAYFFLASWTPTVLISAHLPAETAALAAALIQVGGTVGALVLCRWIERHGFWAIAILFAVSVPVVGSIGYVGVTSKAALLTICFLAGACVLGIQTGINVVGALVYPTSLRANGSGWELGIGRIGSIVGPLVGALLVGLPVQKLFIWAAVPMAAGAIVCALIYKLTERRRLAGRAAGETRPAVAPAE